MSTVDFNKPFSPSLAENGKFVPIDMSTITNYPSTYTNGEGLTGVPTNGRFAVLTYNVGNSTTTQGASSTNPLYVTIAGTNTVTVCAGLNFNNSLSTIIFPTNVTFLEIYNNDSSNKLYISYENLNTVISLTARGLPINAQGYYSIEKSLTNCVIGSNVSTSDIRVYGHSV